MGESVLIIVGFAIFAAICQRYSEQKQVAQHKLALEREEGTEENI